MIQFDASTELTAASGPSWTHIPVGVPKGVFVFIMLNNTSDSFSGVKYGGVPMALIQRESWSSGEECVVNAYYLGVGIPEGSRTVEVTKGVGSTIAHFVCITVTADADTQLAGTTGFASLSGGGPVNPSVTVTGISGLTYGVGALSSGHDSEGSITAGAGMTMRQKHGFGTKTSAVESSTSQSSGNLTIGFTASMEKAAMVGIAIEQMAVASASPSLSASSSLSPSVSPSKSSSLSPSRSPSISPSVSPPNSFSASLSPSVSPSPSPSLSPSVSPSVSPSPSPGIPVNNTSVITAVARVQQNLSFPQFIMGGQIFTGVNSYKLFKKGTALGAHIFRSEVYKVGRDFDVQEVKFSVKPVLAAGMNILPVLYFDNGSIISVGTQINSTNYPAKSYIKLNSKNFDNGTHGQANFFLEFRWIGAVLATIILPIVFELEVSDV